MKKRSKSRKIRNSQSDLHVSTRSRDTRSLQASNTSFNVINSVYDTNSRVMKDVPYPAIEFLKAETVFDATTGKPNIDILKRHFKHEGRLEEDVALKIVNDAKMIMRNEPNLVFLDDPITIVGDIHGQFYDLLKLIKIGGDPATSKYLFLGDYVDRGLFSVECILYLYAFKILYPTTFILLRGNHECRHLTEYFTFRRECCIKYSFDFYVACVDSFDCLPLAAVVNSKFFCVHGGLSPELFKLNDIMRINRFREVPPKGLMCDLLWSDPVPNYDDEHPRKKEAFLHNQTRKCSYYYTFHAVSTFLKENKLLAVVRAHEVQANGFSLFKQLNSTAFPSLITIFSAPNYCDTYGNNGAIIRYEDNLLNTKLFNSSPHPYWFSNFSDAFSFSLPMIGEKVLDILVAILNLINDDSEPPDRCAIIRQKILAISRILRIYTKIRKESEALIHLKGIPSAAESPLNQLISGSSRSSLPPDATKMFESLKLKKKLSFEEVKELDKENEQYPIR